MTGNQVVSTMFDFDTCNHMVRFVLWLMGLKTLDLVFTSRLRWSMYILRHIDPLCMVHGYVILISHFSHRSTVYSGGCAILWLHGSTVYDWWPCPLFLLSSVYDLSMGMPTSELIFMILCWCLIVCRAPIRCALSSWHTHAAYKVYRLSLIPLSDFGGHSVIHIFGHQYDVMIVSW